MTEVIDASQPPWRECKCGQMYSTLHDFMTHISTCPTAREEATTHRARTFLLLAREFGLRSIKVEDFQAEFWAPTIAEMPGVTPEPDKGCPCGHPPEEHGEAGCLRGCDPAKCEEKT